MSDLDRAEDLITAARAAGAVEAEVYVKRACVRRVSLSPIPDPSEPRVTVSTIEERGVALRLLDDHGRWGFAWRSSGGELEMEGLVTDAIESARRSIACDDPGGADQIPCAPPGGDCGDPGIYDGRWLSASVDSILDYLGEGISAASHVAGRCAVVERALLSTAHTTVRLINSRGFDGHYEKTPTLVSVSMVPIETGARASLEERSGCRMEDISPRDCGVEAALRSLPVRPAALPPDSGPSLILGPRTTASLLASLIPGILDAARHAPGRNGVETAPGPIANILQFPAMTLVDNGRAPGMVASAPFDGVGRSTGRTVLFRDGERCGRLSAATGHAIRPSYREPPLVGATTLILEPPVDEVAAADPDSFLRVETALFKPGPKVWRVRVLRGEWYAGGSPAGPADGLKWEGPLERILSGVRSREKKDVRFFHIGIPIGAPSIRIDGLGPWIVEAASARPASLVRRAASREIRPQARFTAPEDRRP